MILIILFISIVFFLTVGFSLYLGISPMPSSFKAKKAILQQLPEKIETLYELGSGWGTLAFPIASAFPNAKIHAFEFSPIPWCVSYLIKKCARFLNLHLHRKNFFSFSLQPADVIICYLFPRAMQLLEKKFERELKPGTCVISNTFALPHWQPEKILYLNDLWNSKIYIYIVPEEPGLSD